MKSKAQIAIEFLIVFAFILLVFLFLFSLITQQRAVIQNTQTYSQLQLVAQNIALQISRAGLSGNGYSAQLPLLTSIGVTPYNVSITKSGTVIVTSTTAQQAVRTTAFSSVKFLSSNPAYLASGSNTVYNIPIANGSISIQNSFGTICVDYQCPVTSNTTSSVSLSSQVVHSAQFNGQSSQISINANSLATLSGQRSLFAWVYIPSNAPSGYASIGCWGGSSGSNLKSCLMVEQAPLTMYFWYGGAGGAYPNSGVSLVPKLGAWNFVGYTYASANSNVILYLNGNSITGSVGSPLNTQANTQFYIGSAGGIYFLNGSIANVQVYNQSLTSAQANQIYGEGISGSPISANLVGWWPLNGDTNDYGGNGNGGTKSGPVIFSAVAQIFATVKNPLGKPVANASVGFATTFGNLTNGLGTQQAQSNYTNSNGIATVFLNQRGNNGQAYVKATVLSGNFLPQSALVAWYPLNLGQGNIAYDLSANKDNGAFSTTQNSPPFWNIPNYVASFDGRTSYITVPNSPTLNFNNQLTYSIWVKKSGPGPQSPRAIVLSRYGTYIDLCYNSQPLFSLNLNSGQKLIQGGSCAPSGIWTSYIATYDGTNARLYLNGAQVANSIYSSTILNSANALTIGGYDNSLFYLNGSIADAQVYKQALSANQVSQLYQEGIAGVPIANTAIGGWWPLDGDSLDYSPDGNNGIIYGNLTFTPSSIAVAPQLISNGNASKVLVASFNAVNSYVSYYQSQNTVLTSASAFGWINTTANNQLILQLQNSSGTNPLIALAVGSPSGFAAGNANQLVVYARNSIGGSGGGTMPLNSNVVVNNNVWHQVGITLSGTLATVYVDGMQASQTTFYGQINLANTLANQIIRISSPGTNSYNGLISNMQIYGTSLSSSQVQQLYQEGIQGAPVTSSNVIAWWALNGNSNDYSPSGLNSTLVSNVVYKNARNYVPYLLHNSNYSGINFNGQNYVATTNNIALNFGYSNPFSISAWIRTSASTENTIVGKIAIPSAVNGYAFETNTGGALRALFWDNNGNLETFSTATKVNDNAWHNVVESYNGNNAISLFIDGVSQNVISNGIITGAIASTGILTLGTRYGTSGLSNFTGSISDVQIYNTNLTASQVKQLYNGQINPSASITVPLSWYP